MTYILIPVTEFDNNCYPVDTDEQCAEAIEALRASGCAESPVWVSPGDEFHPDAYQNGQTLRITTEAR